MSEWTVCIEVKHDFSIYYLAAKVKIIFLISQKIEEKCRANASKSQKNPKDLYVDIPPHN